MKALKPADLGQNLIEPQLTDEERFTIEAYLDASMADNTKRAYRAAWRGFTTYCAGKQTNSLPASVETLMAYATWLASRRANKVATIEIKINAIAYIHDKFGGTNARANNPTRDERFAAVMKGIRRKHKKAQAQKDPITSVELEQMLRELPDDMAGQRDRAILLMGFAGALRRSEIVSLNVNDVRFSPDAMTIRLPYSKTDQEGEGATIKIPRVPARLQLCPVTALKTWLRDAEIEEGPLFRPFDRWGHPRKGRLTGQSVALIVKRAAEMAGLDQKLFSGHSLRAGFITNAAQIDVPEWKIQRVSRHKSSAVLRRYIRAADSAQSDAISDVFAKR